jgi:hypothetical protein
MTIADLYKYTKVSSHFCVFKTRPSNAELQNGLAILQFGITGFKTNFGVCHTVTAAQKI